MWQLLTYTWNFWDGSAPVTSDNGYYGGYASHAYTADGTYTVSVTVTDDANGAAPVTQTLSVTVNRPAASDANRIKRASPPETICQ